MDAMVGPARQALYVLVRDGDWKTRRAILCEKWRAKPRKPDSTLHGPMLRALDRFDEALPFLEGTPPSLFSRIYRFPIVDGVRDDARFRQLIAVCCEAEDGPSRDLVRMLRERNGNDRLPIR